MKPAIIAMGITFTTIISGCSSSSAPSCSDNATKKTAVQIVTKAAEKAFTPRAKDQIKEFARMYGLKYDDDLSKITYNLKNTRTTQHNEKLGSYSCRADLVAAMNGQTSKLPIKYTSVLSDGGDSYYIEIQGLTDERMGELLGGVMMSEGEN